MNQFGCFDSNGKGRRYVKALAPEEVPQRIRYRFSNTNVQPPTGWDPKDMTRSARMPDIGLALEYVFGFAEDAATTSMYVTTNHEIAYYSAATCIVWDVKHDKQRFFVEHEDDISCICMHPNRQYMASGQV